MRKSKRLPVVAAVGLAASLVLPLAATAHQHGSDEGHLLGTGASGKIELVGQVTVHDAEPGLIADVAVDPDLDYAYLARWGGEACASPEGGGKDTFDGGVYVIDIRDPANPTEVGFIPTHQDTLVGEGMQVIRLDTAAFTGDVLVINHEGCGKNFKAGVSLWDVTDPLNPRKLQENFGDITIDGQRAVPDVNQTHSAFAWQAGDRAFVVATDDEEAADVDIFEITDPKKPVLIAEFDLNELAVSQPELGLTDSFLHDMVVKEMNGRFIMLLSYWDGGYVQLDVTDPTNPVLLAESDYAVFDPVFPTISPPEGNAHQAEFTIDNRFVIGTDEDFDPYRLTVNTDDGGAHRAKPGTQTTVEAAEAISGTTVFVGRGCIGDTPVPAAPTTGGPYIAVVERGLCTFEEKVASIEAAGGYSAVIIFNRTGADACNAVLSPFLENEALPVILTTREGGFDLFDVEAQFVLDDCLANTGVTRLESIVPVGTIGDVVTGVDPLFDGWGYVHLFDAATMADLDQYIIPEAADPAFATGFGDLSVHEVAVDPQDPSLAYLSYYAGGLRAIQIVEDPAVCAALDTDDSVVSSTCLVEVGGYLDPAGNNFWGVETFIGDDGFTYILASDRDSGLWIFRDP
jgi:hypothetical protein